MKASELMVYDWVLHDGEPYQIRQLGIHGVDRDGEDYPAVCIGKPKGVGLIVERNEIEPIPLTPEILARMGFTIEEVPKYDDTYTEDEYTAKIKCVDSRKCEVEIEYKTYWKKLRAFNYDPHNRLGFTSIETQVEYVHELQHVMRLCGIGKEIVI